MLRGVFEGKLTYRSKGVGTPAGALGHREPDGAGMGSRHRVLLLSDVGLFCFWCAHRVMTTQRSGALEGPPCRPSLTHKRHSAFLTTAQIS